MNRSFPFLIAVLFLVAALLLAWWDESRPPDLQPLTPRLTGEVEYCLTCHADLPQISSSHPVETFGCVLCHGGERLALEADLAHSTLRGGRNPSDLAVVEASCGGEDCHSGGAAARRDHIARVRTSLQATYAGAIAHVRYTFGAQSDADARLGVFAVRDADATHAGSPASLAAFDPASESIPALKTFAENCLDCHLSAQPRQDSSAFARLTGCAACHTPTAGTDLQQPVHKLTTAIPYTQCNTCHNRGNYNLVDMHFYPRQDAPADRLHDYYQPIAQFVRCEWTLDCVDCHTRTEAMGVGDIHTYETDFQYVQCSTCHGTLSQPPLTRTIDTAADLAVYLAFLNPGSAPEVYLKPGDTIVITQKGEPLWNVRRGADGAFELIGKASRQRFALPLVQGSACQQKEDQQESRYCHSCHAVQR